MHYSHEISTLKQCPGQPAHGTIHPAVVCPAISGSLGRHGTDPRGTIHCVDSLGATLASTSKSES